MATRNLKSKAKAAVKKVSGKRAERKEASQAARKEAPLPPMFDPKQLAAMDFSKVAKMMTPEQAMELYKANAKMALDVINAAMENTVSYTHLTLPTKA